MQESCLKGVRVVGAHVRVAAEDDEPPHGRALRRGEHHRRDRAVRPPHHRVALVAECPHHGRGVVGVALVKVGREVAHGRTRLPVPAWVARDHLEQVGQLAELRAKVRLCGA